MTDDVKYLTWGSLTLFAAAVWCRCRMSQEFNCPDSFGLVCFAVINARTWMFPMCCPRKENKLVLARVHFWHCWLSGLDPSSAMHQCISFPRCVLESVFWDKTWATYLESLRNEWQKIVRLRISAACLCLFCHLSHFEQVAQPPRQICSGRSTPTFLPRLEQRTTHAPDVPISPWNLQIRNNFVCRKSQYHQSRFCPC